MATSLSLTRWGSFACLPPSMNLIGPPVTELLQFLLWYVTWRCDLDLWPIDLGMMSHDATLVFNTYVKFELDTTYRSRVRMTTSFHWLPAQSPNFYVFGGKRGSTFKLHLSNPQKALPWPERRITAYVAWGCVQECDPWACRSNEKKHRNFHASNWLFAQTTLVDIGPWHFACGVMSGS